MYKPHARLLSPDDDGATGGTAAPSPAPAPAPTPSPSPAPSPAPAPAPAPSPAPSPSPAPAPAPTPEAKWPEDWRETVSKGDAKILERMRRYASPDAVASALIAAQNRISAGELKPVLGKNPTPEQMVEYRSANGIPEKPEGYAAEDLKITSGEKPFFDQLFTKAHETNQTPEQVKATIALWRDVQVQVAEAQQTSDEAGRDAATDQLRAEWGTDFRRNTNLISGMLDGSGSQELKGMFLDARLPNGEKVGNNADVMRMLVGLALVGNPTGVVVPGGSGDLSKGIKDALDEITKVMKTDRDKYNKDSKMQTRYRELTDAALKAGLMDDMGRWKDATPARKRA